MNAGILSQGQPLSALGLPDHVSEGAAPWRVGQMNVQSITVSQLAGPMGWYDVGVVVFDNERPTQMHPLHMCEHIAI
jgi:hypothetical protein